MKPGEQKNLTLLRLFVSSLTEHKDFLDTRLLNYTYVDTEVFRQIADEIKSAKKLLPSLIPAFKEKDFLTLGRYSARALSMYLSRCLSRLRGELPASGSSPVTEERDFSFMRNESLRGLLERDYPEIQRAFVAECWKAVVVVAGSAIEAVLLDLALQNAAAARAARSAPAGGLDITRWSISELINVCTELEMVPAGAGRLSHSVREYRNLVHPGYEMRSRLSAAREEARIAVEVLNLLQRELATKAAFTEGEAAQVFDSF